jgi:hypothetical protein
MVNRALTENLPTGIGRAFHQGIGEPQVGIMRSFTRGSTSAGKEAVWKITPAQVEFTLFRNGRSVNG